MLSSTKADHSNLVLKFECVCDEKIESAVMGNKTGFCRSSHRYVSLESPFIKENDEPNLVSVKQSARKLQYDALQVVVLVNSLHLISSLFRMP